MRSTDCFGIFARDYFSFIIEFAAQRQVGETALNDNSSRSHQIIRLVRLTNMGINLLSSRKSLGWLCAFDMVNFLSVFF